MRTIIAILTITTLFGRPASGQDIISRSTSILNSGGMFYVVDSVLYDNGQALADLKVSRSLVGDTSQVVRYLKSKAMEAQENIAKEIAEAMGRNRANADFLAYRSIYNQVSGADLFQDIEEELYQDYAGAYRVFDLEADSSFVANLIRVGAGNRYRLEHAQTGQRWAVLPLSRENFRLVGWNGQDVDLYYDREPRKNGIRVFEDARRIIGQPAIRIAKISNQ